VNTWKKKALLRTSVLASFAAVAGTAVAQEPLETTQPEAAPEARESIQVTGSRILRRDAVAESPILTITQEDVTQSGYVTLEQFLNTLPQVTPGLSSQSNNPSSNGRAFIDLRGLGSGRNIVLIDGRRGMGSTAGGTVDVNTIPAALIERTEIITGGAASTYGADAVSGVVNFILRRDFEGLAIDSQYRVTEQGDGVEYGADFTLGGRFAEGRGNAVFNASYFNRDAMYKDAREFSAQAQSATGIFPGGNWATGANQPSQAAVDAVFGPDACATTGGQAGFAFNPDGSLFCTGLAGNPNRNAVGFNGPDSWIATQFFPDAFSYNFEPDNILVLPMERWSFYSHVDYEVNQYFRPYASAMFTNYNALQELAPTPAGGLTVPVTNPFITPQLAALLASRPDPTAPFAFSKRTNVLGGRTGFNTHDVWQLTTGVEGDIPGSSTWQYDVYGSFGRSVLNEAQGGNINLPRTQELLNAPGGGTGICEGGLNLFGTAPISDACVARISFDAKNLTVVEQAVVEAVFTGDLFELPAGTVQGAFGASYRSLDFDFQPDQGLQPGIVAGFNEQLPVSGFLDYVDVFGEVLIPIISGRTFAEDVSITAGFRQTDNNISGTGDSWKLNGDWTVNDWLRFRGGYQEAIAAPSVTQLFSPQTNNFPAYTDPCNANNTDSTGRAGPNGAQVAALCAAQGAVTADPGYQQSFGQAQALGGGNPNLTPEESQSWTAGFVMSSPWQQSELLSSLFVSVDYWSIELENVIGAVGANTIIQRCFNQDGANPSYDPNNEWCQLFTRDASTGRPNDVLTLSRNQAFLETSGVDIVVGWGYDLGNLGQLDFNLISTWVEKFTSQVTSADPVNDFIGTIGSGTGSATPEWRFTLNTAYSWERVGINLTTRYIDNMVHANTVTGGSGTGVPATWYQDIRGTFDLTDRVTLRAGVNNVFDQQPRLYNPSIQANTDPSSYDVLGRRYFVGINARF
jgi:iron complex outermembrane recepter protein